ncbi:ROK family protein [Bdellovibrio reynosensis]|uniref:ROK family protein n=1 Tax=Bdellovibrio reynosensis TaxID=2835041 RepID=A0ABY4C9S0_9BACT|nr:ROK family protein [Bdellovibrio reynosensis]UOF00662.1 ROK family protein [Bdellovibrio reynosensis]
MKKKTYTIGFDLGGTKLAAALLDNNGTMLDFIKVPVDMKREKSAVQTQKRVIGLMADIALDFKQRFPKETTGKNFLGIGLASAGPLNAAEGKLIHPVNYPGWKIVPIRDLVEKEVVKRGFKTKVYFQHDATAAALAEGWVGGGAGMSSFAVVSVGTGVGSGVIFNGFPAQSRGMGSEYGHTIVDFKKLQESPDKLHHCTVEGVASGTGLLRRAKEMGFQGSSVEELVASKDAKYQVLFKEMSWALACLCYDLSIGYNLERIFLSGGLIKIKNLYFNDLKSHYKRMIQQMNPAFECKIEVAKTKNHAGVLGAGYLPYLALKK